VLYGQKLHAAALELYDEAVAIDPSCHVYYCNRAACYATLRRWDEAAAVSRCFLACNGSPCLRHCGHGASIGGAPLPAARARLRQGSRPPRDVPPEAGALRRRATPTQCGCSLPAPHLKTAVILVSTEMTYR
jgi:hypothetical protein